MQRKELFLAYLEPMTASPKPTSRSAYLRWLAEKFDERIDTGYGRYFEDVLKDLRNQWERTARWQGLLAQLAEWDAEYQAENDSYGLLMRTDAPHMEIKTFESFLIKTWRHNVLDNTRWPEQPRRGWWEPSGWFEAVNDLVRGRLTVKYLDGVLFLGERITAMAHDCGGSCNLALEARSEGYYAAHLYFVETLGLPTRTFGDKHPAQIKIELQLTTQVKEVISRLTHGRYEQRRLRGRSREKWEWQYDSEEFVPNYLGHLIHYVEGMIMDVRGKQATSKPIEPANWGQR